MDSITQAALGATLAGAIAGKRCNGKVLLCGAMLGTLPDLDVLIDYGDAVSNTIKHRGFTHSLYLIPVVAYFLAWLYCRLRPDPFWRFSRVLGLLLAVLITHPLLDAMTTYGTQLLWPQKLYFEVRNIFIIDPLYTLPLLIAIGVACVSKLRGAKVCQMALLLSSLYLVWGYGAQQMIASRVAQNLQAQQLKATQVLITPTAFNTLLWRVVLLGENARGEAIYWEGLASLLDEQAHIEFSPHLRGQWPLQSQPETLIGLKAFSHGFLRYREHDDMLIVSDLRIGMAQHLAFEFIYARKTASGQWQLLDAPQRLEGKRDLSFLAALWLRLKGDQSINSALSNALLSRHN